MWWVAASRACLTTPTRSCASPPWSGPEFELGVVQAAGQLSEDTLLAAVEEAASARVVIEVSATRYRFAHALMRATLYESLSAARQVALHRKTAEAIEAIHQAALDDYVPALAHHWAKASAPVTDPARAVDYARMAGDRALAQLANDEAATYYASGLELLDAGGAEAADTRRLELLIGRGEAQRRAGDPGYRQSLLDAANLAQQVGDIDALVRAAQANTLGNVWTGVLEVDAERVETLRAALEAIGEGDSLPRARLLATLGLELAWEPDAGQRLAHSEEALRIARALGDPETLAHVLLARDYTITAPENAAERFAATTELLSIADGLGDPVAASRALSLRFKAAMELTDVAEAERSLARNRELVAELGQPTLTWVALHHHATLRLLREEIDAEAAMEAAYEFGVSARRPSIGVFKLAQQYWLLHERGRSGELEEAFRQLTEQTRYPMMTAGYATIFLEKGQEDRAAELFDELAATGFAHPTNNVAWLHFHGFCAILCARLGRRDCVSLLTSRLEPWSDQLIAAAFAGWISGPVTYHLGLLATTTGEWGEAESYFAAAAATQERIAAPTWLARTRLEWARMLLARAEPNDADRAHDLLRQALATARERGLTKLEGEAVALLSGA